MIDLRGKKILVTGSSRGIGRAILEACHAAGGDVVLHYGRSADAAMAVRAELGEERCFTVQAELGELGDLQRLWQSAVAWKGGIDVLVNNASIRIDLDVAAPDAEWDAAWRKVLDVNLVAPAHLSRMAIGHFRERGGGCIVNMASRPAFRGDTPTCPYDGAAKGGLVSLSRQIARHHGRDGVKAFVVAPGIIETDQASEFFATSGREQWLAEIPAGRFGKPQDIANMVAFLASGLGDYATGATIDINGASYVH